MTQKSDDFDFRNKRNHDISRDKFREPLCQHWELFFRVPLQKEPIICTVENFICKFLAVQTTGYNEMKLYFVHIVYSVMCMCWIMILKSRFGFRFAEINYLNFGFWPGFRNVVFLELRNTGQKSWPDLVEIATYFLQCHVHASVWSNKLGLWGQQK